jgi:hypothetical protein
MPLPSSKALSAALARYESTIDGQGVARLPELDRWYRLELPALFARRTSPHLTHAELVRVTEWKMARGVWRQPNLVRVRGNAPARVECCSAAALARIPHPTAPIAELTTLDGVGPATASAIVAAVAPSLYPFFDEQVAAQLPGLGPVKWTLSYYARYADALRQAAAELGREWTPATLERALWAHVGGKAGVRG